MDPSHKKVALRMIPYGLYVLTAEAEDGTVAAATVNWVTQTSFEPPLVALGVKRDSVAHAIIKQAGVFALNILGKAQQATAFAFFKSVERKGDTIGGEPFRTGTCGAPILESVPAWIECRLRGTLEEGDHSLFLGEVIDAGVTREPAGRPDAETLRLGDLGEKTFYGG